MEKKWQFLAHWGGTGSLVTNINAKDNILEIEQSKEYIIKFSSQKAVVDINEISEIVAKQKWLNGTFLSEKDFKKKIRNLLEQERTFWKKAVDTKKEYAPDDEREIMISKEGLAATESLLGNTAEGIRILNETLDFFKRTTKDDSESVANVYVYLCLAYEKADRLS